MDGNDCVRGAFVAMTGLRGLRPIDVLLAVEDFCGLVSGFGYLDPLIDTSVQTHLSLNNS